MVSVDNKRKQKSKSSPLCLLLVQPQTLCGSITLFRLSKVCVHLIRCFYIYFVSPLCDSIFFSSHVYLLPPLLSLPVLHKMVWRLCGPPSGGGPQHFVNFHSLRSFQVQQPSKPPQPAQCVLFMNPPPSLHTLMLLKYYSPSGTSTERFGSNGCCLVIRLHGGVVLFVHFCVHHRGILVWPVLIMINLMIIVLFIKHV